MRRPIWRLSLIPWTTIAQVLRSAARPAGARRAGICQAGIGPSSLGNVDRAVGQAAGFAGLPE